MTEPTRRWVMARICAPHGVRGWVRVQSYADPPESLLERAEWHLRLPGGAARAYRLRDGSWDGRWLRVAFEDVADRDDAERLRNAELEVERQDLPAPGAREYYRDDLLGFAVCNRAGAQLGTVQYFIDAPANAVMVVSGAHEYWIPATRRHLLRVVLADRRVEVDWPAEP